MARCLVRQITVTNLTWSCGFVLRDVTFLILQWLVKYRCTNVTPLRRRQPLHTVERPVANKSGPYTFGFAKICISRALFQAAFKHHYRAENEEERVRAQ